MLIINILHFIFGYVSFSANNGFSERFINICTADGIPLWNIKRDGDCLYARTSAKGYRMIRKPAKASGMKIHMIKKTGLPFIAIKYRTRNGLLISLAVAFAALVLLSGHIWVIEVDGNTTVSGYQIESAFEEAGLKIGKKISSLDIVKIKVDALQKLDDISWAAINIRGCTAVIEVRERTQSPETESENGTSNIVATKDGLVQIIEPYRGTSAVKPGTTVLKGDLLISGVKESRTQSYLFCDAKGYVVASTSIYVNNDFYKRQTVLKAITKKVYSFNFLGHEISLNPKKNNEPSYFHKSWAYIGGKKMPFGIYYRLYTEYEKQNVTYSAAEAKLTAVNRYNLKAYHDTLHTQINNKKITLSEKNDKVTIKGNYDCYENIIKRSEFDIEEIPEAKEVEDNNSTAQ